MRKQKISLKTLYFMTLIIFTSCKAQTLHEIEKANNVKIGAYAIDTNNKNIFAYRQNEKFAFQSTFKLLVTAYALKSLGIDDKIKITNQDIVFWSPIVRLQLKQGYMSTKELAKAAMMYSDNAATNILINRLGGINSINNFARSIGNKSFYLANMETNLNSNPSNINDTATPKDMAQSVYNLLIKQHILTKNQQKILKTWMLTNTTGYNRMRSGLPLAGWSIAEKTGGSSTVSNDIGIIWSPACKPIVLAIYTLSEKKNNPKQDLSIKQSTQTILAELAKQNNCFAATKLR